MSSKKKIQITVPINTREELNPYLDPKYQKVVVINAYAPFWGPCDVAESMLKRFIEEPANANKLDFLSIPCDQIEDIVPKECVFGSKPKYFIFVKGELYSSIEGINYPKMTDEINKSYQRFEEPIL